MRLSTTRTLFVAALAATSVHACTPNTATDPANGAAAPAAGEAAEAPTEAEAPAAEAPAAEAPAAEAPAAEAPAAEPAAPSAVLQPIAQTAYQPCAITVASSAATEQECFSIEQVRVAGQPVSVCLQATEPYAFTYNEQGRLLTDGWRTIEYAADGTASLAGAEEAVLAVTFDDAGRFLQLGESVFRYDEHGRLVHTSAEGMFNAVVYAADGTSTTDHNYPDSDEVCEAEITAVEGDPVRPTMQRVERCEINEVPRTVRYERDAYGRVTSFTVDARNDGTVDATATVSYDCHAG